ncbi:hypothetical protein KDL29_12260 [bacterium]|nr:hypothetical protein [bacterium]
MTDNEQPQAELEQQEKPRSIMAWLRYAFAIEEFSEDSLSAEEKDVLQNIAEIIDRRGMSTPAILWIESHRHLNFTGSQLVKIVEPLHDLSYEFMRWLMMKLGVGYITPEQLSKLQSALEKRYSIEYLLQQIEQRASRTREEVLAARQAELDEEQAGDGQDSGNKSD